MRPLLFLIVDNSMEIFGGDSLLWDGWSWLMVIYWFGATSIPLLDGGTFLRLDRWLGRSPFISPCS